MSSDHHDALPGNTWLLLAEAVAETAARLKISEGEASGLLVDAARCGTVYSRGRLHSAVSDPPFLINPAAWAGMDVDVAFNRLICPNLLEVVQHAPNLWSGSIAAHREPFLNSPIICDVRLHRGSLRAWLEGGPRAEVPQMPAPPASERLGPIVWNDPAPPARSAAPVEPGERSAPPAAAMTTAKKEVSEAALRAFLSGLEREIGRPPAKQIAYEKARDHFAGHIVPRHFVWEQHGLLWPNLRPGPRTKDQLNPAK